MKRQKKNNEREELIKKRDEAKKQYDANWKEYKTARDNFVKKKNEAIKNNKKELLEYAKKQEKFGRRLSKDKLTDDDYGVFYTDMNIKEFDRIEIHLYNKYWDSWLPWDYYDGKLKGKYD